MAIKSSCNISILIYDVIYARLFVILGFLNTNPVNMVSYEKYHAEFIFVSSFSLP